ncbi:putative metalloprotease CJM1_0395 family protein [Oceanisphaera sp.]|uniref:putative metalloprotease CJM1_0395 family protein n=1 Tax=Oceanisphaera sp. TaxID=1929979 RepID=UPI003A8E98F0
MHISRPIQDLSTFTQPVAASQIQQDNEQRPRIEPVVTTEQAATGQSATDSFSSSEQSDVPELYNRQGKTDGAAHKDDDQTSESAATETDEEIAASTKKNAAGKELTPEQQEALLQLQQRDREVRVHEQQHASVGGQHTGAPSYQYETGPDGKQYAVEGKVSVDLSPVAGDPVATIEKMQQVKAAALAPAEPSQADKNAAARAEQLIIEARAELQQAAAPGKDGLSRAEKPTTVKSQTDIATDTPTAKDASGQMQLRNQVIAGVYGKAAQAHSQQLLNLA